MAIFFHQKGFQERTNIRRVSLGVQSQISGSEIIRPFAKRKEHSCTFLLDAEVAKQRADKSSALAECA